MNLNIGQGKNRRGTLDCNVKGTPMAGGFAKAMAIGGLHRATYGDFLAASCLPLFFRSGSKEFQWVAPDLFIDRADPREGPRPVARLAKGTPRGDFRRRTEPVLQP